MEPKDYLNFIKFLGKISDVTLRKFFLDFLEANPEMVPNFIQFYKSTGEFYITTFNLSEQENKAATIEKIFSFVKKDSKGKMVPDWRLIFIRSRQIVDQLEGGLAKMPSDEALDTIMLWINGFIDHFKNNGEKVYSIEELRQVCCPFLDILAIYVDQEDVSDEMLQKLCEWLFGIRKKEGHWRGVFHNDLVNMAIKVISLKRVSKSLRAALLEENQDNDTIKCHYVKTNFLALIDNNETEKAHEYIIEHLTDYGVLGFYLEFLKSKKSYLFLMHLITHALLGAFPTNELKECVDMVYELYLQGKRDMGKINLPLPGFPNSDLSKDTDKNKDQDNAEAKESDAQLDEGQNPILFEEYDSYSTPISDSTSNSTTDAVTDLNSDPNSTSGSSEEVESLKSSEESNQKDEVNEENGVGDAIVDPTKDDNAKDGENKPGESLAGFDLDLSDLDKIEFDEIRARMEDEFQSMSESNDVPLEIKPEDMSELNVYLMIPDESMAENYRLYFIRSHGDMTYYRRMKKLIPEDQWADYLKKTMEETEFLPSMYLDMDPIWGRPDSNIKPIASTTDNRSDRHRGTPRKVYYQLDPRKRSNIIEVFIEEGDYDSLSNYMLSGGLEDFYDSILDVPQDRRKDLLEEYYRRILNGISSATTRNEFTPLLPHLARLIAADPTDEYIHEFFELEKSLFDGDNHIQTEWILFLLRNGFNAKGERIRDFRDNRGR